MGKRLVIIGNGMASARLVRDVKAMAPDAYEITIIGDEPRPAYNRVLLSSLLAEDVSEADLNL